MSSNLLSGILGLLMASAPYVATFCFVVAAFQLRNEGGVNYATSGAFAKWIVWGVIFLTLGPITTWLNSNVSGGAVSFASGSVPSYMQPMQNGVTAFVQSYLVPKIVPTMAGCLVLKAMLDAGEGYSPLQSLIPALLLLGIQGFINTVTGFANSSTTQTGTADVLSSLLNWALTQVAPVIGVLSVYGAIMQFIRNKDWATPTFVAGSLLMASVVWKLVQSWAGVSV